MAGEPITSTFCDALFPLNAIVMAIVVPSAAALNFFGEQTIVLEEMDETTHSVFDPSSKVIEKSSGITEEEKGKLAPVMVIKVPPFKLSPVVGVNEVKVISVD